MPTIMGRALNWTGSPHDGDEQQRRGGGGSQSATDPRRGQPPRSSRFKRSEARRGPPSASIRRSSARNHSRPRLRSRSAKRLIWDGSRLSKAVATRLWKSTPSAAANAASFTAVSRSGARTAATQQRSSAATAQPREAYRGHAATHQHDGCASRPW